jgi:hypothetical protein
MDGTHGAELLCPKRPEGILEPNGEQCHVGINRCAPAEPTGAAMSLQLPPERNSNSHGSGRERMGWAVRYSAISRPAWLVRSFAAEGEVGLGAGLAG